MTEILIETLQRFYNETRKTTGADVSFHSACDALTHYVLSETEELAAAGDLAGIRALLRQYREIGLSVAPSNDAMKEKFEREYANAHRGHGVLH